MLFLVRIDSWSFLHFLPVAKSAEVEIITGHLQIALCKIREQQQRVTEMPLTVSLKLLCSLYLCYTHTASFVVSSISCFPYLVLCHIPFLFSLLSPPHNMHLLSFKPLLTYYKEDSDLCPIKYANIYLFIFSFKMQRLVQKCSGSCAICSSNADTAVQL